MKALVVNISKYLGLVFILFGANYAINSYFLTHSKIDLKDCKILIAGDSHPMTAVDPSLGKQCMSVTQSLEPYIITYHKLKYLLKNNPTIEKVVLGCGTENISAFNDRKLKDNLWSGTLMDRAYALLSEENLTSVPYSSRMFFYTKFIKHMMLYPIPNPYKGIRGGFKKTKYVLDKSDVNGPIKRHYYLNGENVGVSKIAICYLDSIVTLTKNLNIELTLVHFPVHKNYSDLVPDNFKKRLAKLHQKYAIKQVKFLDLNKLNLPDNLYKDHDHVNSDGAKVVSEYLFGEI